MEPFPASRAENQIPFYLEHNTQPTKRAAEHKRVTKEAPLTNSNPMILTPQRNRAEGIDKSMELERLLSSIYPVGT